MLSLLPLARRIFRELGRRALVLQARLWIVLHPSAARRIRDEGAWLFGAAVGRAFSDNSAALFRYVREARSDITAYWAIDEGSPDLRKAEAVGPIVLRDTIECRVRVLLARVAIVSHGIHDLPGMMSPGCKAYRVRLGHGITATRARRRHTFAAVERLNNQFDLIPVSSEFELQNKLSWGIPRERLVVAGVPRLDTLLALQRETPTDPKTLLYMPTWRDGTVVSLGTFAESHYAQGLSALLNSDVLHNILERHDAHLHVAFHPIARPLAMQVFGKPRTSRIIIDAAPDPQALFARAAALVTDYSSVVWDFLYIDKPVFFYQFDREALETQRGSHMGDRGWPGPVAVRATQLIEILDRYLAGDRTSQQGLEPVEEWKKAVFRFRDDRNCERVVAEIEKRLA